MFLVKKKYKEAFRGCLLFKNTRKNFKSNLVLVVVFVLQGSLIFLDREGHLHCGTMEEKYGLPFCS